MPNDKVDTRVVRMEFDNKQFEKNVRQTSKSVDNLKKTLDFKSVGDGLDIVKVKISALEIATVTFISRITNKLINLSVTLVKSLSVDNIASGWDKFGEKTISVATMMAQKIRVAGREITEVAEKTEVVNNLLEKLTWFADETSYSLSDMTNYASKFIASGQDLDKAVNAMEGIATWAALAGQNSQVASRVMQQLAQAMGRTINRQDWMSIQTANMDMEEFREQVLETAVSLGELTKEGDKFVTKTGKKFEKSGFTNFFSEGWFTSDVLVTTLNKYSKAVDQIYSLAEEKGLTASEVIEQYSDQLDEFGLKAFKAAQEARTFRDVLNSVKDAVTSKWMITFENIFGGKDEAIKLWTELSNRLYEVFAESGNFRNDVLAIWKKAGGRDDLFGDGGAFWNIYDAIKAIADLIKRAWNTIFPISEIESIDDRTKDIARTFKNLTARIKEFTKRLTMSEKTSRRLSKIFETVFGLLRVGLVTIRAIKYALEPIFYTLKQLADITLGRLTKMSGGFEGVLVAIVKVANRLRNVLWDLIELINPAGILSKSFDLIESLYNTIKESKPFETLLKIIDEFVKSFRKAGGSQENLIKIFKALLSVLSVVIKAFIELGKVINKYVLPIVNTILTVLSKIVGYLSGYLVSIIASISEVLMSINDVLLGNNRIDKVGNSINGFVKSITSGLTKLIPVLKSLSSILGAIIDVVLLIPRLLDAISIRLTGRGIIDNIKKFFESISNAINNFINYVGSKKSSKNSEGIFSALLDFFEGLFSVVKGLIAIGQVLIQSLGKVLSILGNVLQKVADILSKLVNGKWNELSSTAKSALITIGNLAIILVIAYLGYSVFYSLTRALNPLAAVMDSAADALDSLKLDILSAAINRFSKSLLRFAISLYIIDNLSTTMKSILAAAAIIGVIIALIYFFKDIVTASKQWGKNPADGIKEAAENVKNITEEVKKSNSVFSEFAKVISSVGNFLLKLAVAMLILDNIKPETFYRSLLLITVLFANIAILLLGISASMKIIKSKEGEIIDSNSIIKIFKTVMVAMSVLLLSIAILTKQLATVDEESFNRAKIVLWSVTIAMIGILAALALLIYNINSRQGTIADQASKANANARKIFSVMAGLIGVLLSLTTFVVILTAALGILSSIKKESLITSISILGGTIGGILLLLTILASVSGKGSANFSGNLSALATSLIKVSLAILILAKSFSVMADSCEKLSKINSSSLLTNIGILTGALAALLLISKFAGTSIPLLGALSIIIFTISSSMLLLGVGINLISKSINALSKSGPVLITFFGNLAKALVNFVTILIPGLIKAVVSTIPIILGQLKIVIDALNQFLISVAPSIAQTIFKVTVILLTILLEYLDPIIALLNKILYKLIMGGLSFLRDSIKDIVVKLVEITHRLIEAFAEQAPIITKDIIKLTNTIIDIIINVANNTIGRATSKFLDLGMKMMGSLLEGIIKITNKIVEYLGKLTKELIKIGEQLIAGLAEGINRGIGRLLTSPFQIFKGFIDGIKSVFGIHSPSRLFKEYGEYMIQGLYVGLKKESERDQEAMNKIFKDVTHSFEEAMFSDDNEYDHVISIGMDISNVEEQTSKVQDLMSAINNPWFSPSGYNADRVSKSLSSRRIKTDKEGTPVNNDNSINTTNNNTFNITSTDPSKAADEIDRILKKNSIKANLAKGKI